MVDPFSPIPPYLDPDQRSLMELREDYDRLLERYALLSARASSSPPLDWMEPSRALLASNSHHDVAIMLLRLAYMRGRCDEMERAGAPTIVLRACPACLGKREG